MGQSPSKDAVDKTGGISTLKQTPECYGSSVHPTTENPTNTSVIDGDKDRGTKKQRLLAGLEDEGDDGGGHDESVTAAERRNTTGALVSLTLASSTTSSSTATVPSVADTATSRNTTTCLLDYRGCTSFGINSAKGKMRKRERGTPFPTPVPRDVLANYDTNDHLLEDRSPPPVPPVDSKNAIKICPGYYMKITKSEISEVALLPLIDIQRGKLFYGTRLASHFSRACLQEGAPMKVTLHIQIPDGPGSWVQITDANWDRIVVKRKPMLSRALVKDYNMQHTEEIGKPEVFIYGTEDDPVFRPIEALPCYVPRNNDVIHSGTTQDGNLEMYAICIICGAHLLGGKFSTMNRDRYLTLSPGTHLTRKQQAFLVAHVTDCHPTVPFAFMDQWKNVQEKELADIKALIQEALFTAYSNLGGLDPSLFADLYETRSDGLLKARLSYIFGGALIYTKLTLPNNLKKRTYIINWLKEGEENPCASKQKARTKVLDDKVVQTGARWIKNMDECFFAFDFVTFLDCHKGNWRCMWNSMVYFFSHGLYFEQSYPPVRAIKELLDMENFNIVDSLDKALRDGCNEEENKRKTDETWEGRHPNKK